MKKLWNDIYRDVLSEFISIFILTAMQTGIAATNIIGGNTEGNAFSAALGCGLTVMVAVYVGGGVSGAHINPCVTSTFAIIGKTPWVRVPFYFAAQYVGAFMGAAATHGLYKGAMLSYSGDYTDLSAIWTTFPAKFLSPSNAMLDSMFSSGLLLLLILAVSDERNMQLDRGMSPLFYGLVVATIGFGFSYNCGNPMNPARDLGPRLWAYVSGHGPAVMNGPNYMWWWIPVVFPHIGALIGALIYQGLIELHYPDEEKVQFRRPSALLELANEKGSDSRKPEIELLLASGSQRISVVNGQAATRF